ncbi:CheR family methyltransferase [Altererythrobacter sp. MF3-039]|uniref:CheR family methyltransferase n=1 Tax=Altererythrobacter sp. MF3-039 TaxID=3252901 RepID=UPI00390CCC1A
MDLNDVSIRYIADLLCERTGQQLTEGRLWRIGTALSGIYRQRGITNIEQLVCLLDRPEEKTLAQEVVEALLNNETYFFRDPLYFETLADKILPDLAEKRRHKRKLTIWSAGCSTGQEVLSLSMIFAEQASRWNDWQIEILGTDISGQAIDAARSGKYSQFEIQRGLAVNRMLNFFEESEAGWLSSDRVSRLVRFSRHNLLDPPPSASPFDLVLCRNVLLYFDGSTRDRAFARLQQALAPDGWLMLGAGETVVGQTRRFHIESGLSGIYRPSGPVSVKQLRATPAGG